MTSFWAIVPAGGAGTRLWPLSRRSHPKFLLDLTGAGRTMIQATVDRLAPIATGVVVVTGVHHADAVAAQLPEVPRERILAEPSPRDSMPAIGWAAAVIERLDPDAVVGSFAADHVIGDVGSFGRCVAEAVAVARTGKLVTIGIAPTFPATGFGYIRQGARLGVAAAPSAREVTEFVEKPDEATARAYLETGEFCWNAGMFVAKASVVLDLLATYDPEAAEALRAIAADPSRLGDLWPTVTREVIDRAVAEPAAADRRVAVVPATFAWDDVGDFDALGSLVAEGEGMPGTRVVGDASRVLSHESAAVVATTTDRLVALVGLDDVVVVDTPDALLVMSRGRAQDVKAIVDRLKASGRNELI